MSVDLTKIEQVKDDLLKEILEKHSSENLIDLSEMLQIQAFDLDLQNITKILKTTVKTQLYWLTKVKELNYNLSNMPQSKKDNVLIMPFAVKLVQNPTLEFQKEAYKINKNSVLHFQQVHPDVETIFIKKHYDLCRDLKSISLHNQMWLAKNYPLVLSNLKNISKDAIKIALEKDYRLIRNLDNPSDEEMLYCLNAEFLVYFKQALSISNPSGVVDKEFLGLFREIPKLSHFKSFDEAKSALEKRIYIKHNL